MIIIRFPVMQTLIGMDAVFAGFPLLAVNWRADKDFAAPLAGKSHPITAMS